MAAFRPREYNLGSADNALIGAQLSHHHAGGAATNRHHLRTGACSTNYSCPNSWKATAGGATNGACFAGMSSVSRTGKFGWLMEGAAVRPWTYTHNTLPLSYSHLHQPLGHPAGGNFVEGANAFGPRSANSTRCALGYLHRVQGRSVGGGEFAFVCGWERCPGPRSPSAMGKTAMSCCRERAPPCRDSNSIVSMPLGGATAWAGWKRLSGLGCGSRTKTRLGAWQEPWNAGRLEIGMRQARVMDERDW